MSKRTRKLDSADLLLAPAYPHSGSHPFNRLRSALTAVLGFQPSFAQLGRIVGQKANLTHYWFRVLPHTHLIGFLSLLERLPDRKRLELINDCCRELPALDNPRLAHDPLAVTAVENLLGSSHGITLVRGGTEFQRTFLAASLGHSLPRLQGASATVGGVDLHQPTKWVPIEGVVYFKQPLRPARVKQLLIEVWPSILASTSPLILLNGVWSVAPEIQEDILRLARNHHVVLVDAKTPEPRSLAEKVGGPVHVITIAAGEQGSRIRMEVEAV